MPSLRSGDADLFYDVVGDGDAVLMIMGLGTDSSAFALQVPEISKRYRTIVFDNRGVGRSSVPPGPYSTEQMATDALAVLDAAGAERAHVFGFSLGGSIAQHMALKAPERIRSMLLTSTWAGPSAWRTRLRRMQLEIVARGGRDALIRSRMIFVLAPPVFEKAPKLVEMVERRMLEDGASLDGYLAQLDAAEAHDLRGRLGEIEVPTRVLAGSRDILVPFELSREVADLVPGATFRLLETGHAMQLEAAEELNRETLEFFASH